MISWNVGLRLFCVITVNKFHVSNLRDNMIFDQYLAFYRKWNKTEPQLLGTPIKTHAIHRMVSSDAIFNDLKWPITQIVSMAFDDEYLINSAE